MIRLSDGSVVNAKSLYEVAIHESVHPVIAWYCGMRVRRASLCPPQIETDFDIDPRWIRYKLPQ
jgi:hypothetical protein